MNELASKMDKESMIVLLNKYCNEYYILLLYSHGVWCNSVEGGMI